MTLLFDLIVIYHTHTQHTNFWQVFYSLVLDWYTLLHNQQEPQKKCLSDHACKINGKGGGKKLETRKKGKPSDDINEY